MGTTKATYRNQTQRNPNESFSDPQITNTMNSKTMICTRCTILVVLGLLSPASASSTKRLTATEREDQRQIFEMVDLIATTPKPGYQIKSDQVQLTETFLANLRPTQGFKVWSDVQCLSLEQLGDDLFLEDKEKTLTDKTKDALRAVGELVKDNALTAFYANNFDKLRDLLK